MAECETCCGVEMRPPESRSPAARYAVAVAVAILVVGLWMPLRTYLAMDHGSYILSAAAVLVSATFGGLYAGLLTTGLLAAAIALLWVPALRGSVHLLRWDDLLLICVFLASGWMISHLAEQMWSAVRKAESIARSEADAKQRLLESEARYQQLVDTLRRSKEDAEAASSAKDQFLAVLSHELRTPLSPVLLTASTLEGDSTLPEEVRESMHAIRQNVELEARLIDDLLDLTGIARGKLKLHKALTDAHTLLGQALYMVERDVNGKRLKVRVRLDAARGDVEADPARLEQVFLNLIKNAVKFTPDEGVISIRTRTECSKPGDIVPAWFVAEICDTGVGIPPDALPRIFRPFEQGSAGVTHRFGGLGLGLAISRSIIEMHGGWIRAMSEGPGKGATFTVGLPLAHVPAVTMPQEHPPLPPRGAIPPRPLRILLVEDHPATRRAMASILRSLGHNVHPAATHADALHADEQEPFDLVISDLALPDGSGHDLMRQLKSRHPIHGLAVSGYGMEDDLRRSREAGFDEHLIKPVSRDKIRDVLTRLGAQSPV